MLALKIIGGIVLFFCLLMLIPVGGRTIYSEDGLFLWLKISGFSIQLVPMREKKRKDKPQKRRKSKKSSRKQSQRDAQPDSNQPQEAKKPGELKQLLPLIRPALTALGRLRRKLTIRQMQVYYRIGGAEDPAGAAVKYGIVAAGGGALFPLVNSAFLVKNWDVNLDVDFESDQTRVAFAAEGGWRLGQLVMTALALGVSALKIYADRPKQPEQKKTEHRKEELKHGRKASDR